MGLFPWRDGDPVGDGASNGDSEGAGVDEADPEERDGAAAETGGADAPVVEATFQDGSLAVYEDRVRIERPGASRFDTRTIDLADVVDARYSGGWVVGHLQIDEAGVPADAGGLLSSPVDENTLHFGAGGRDAAQRARDAIRERAGRPR